MISRNLIWSTLVAVAAMFSSCVKDATEQVVEIAPADPAASKVVFSSDDAIGGQLLIRIGEESVSRVETGVATRSGVTRSGIDELDATLEGVGVTLFERLFPIDSRNEERTREAGLHRWYVAHFDAQADLDEAALAIAKVAEVENVEFCKKMHHITGSEVVPLGEAVAAEGEVTTNTNSPFNDPYLSAQWSYINTGDKKIYAGIAAGADINCEAAWKICTGDPRVVVAVVDDCVQWDHPDLAANMWVNQAELNGAAGIDDDGNGYVDDIYGENFVRNDKPLTISDRRNSSSAPEHGTHVAGTIAAVNNNGVGVCGVAGGTGKGDGVRLMSCQVVYNDAGFTGDIVAKGIKYAADNGACILQCSFGYASGSFTTDSQYSTGAQTSVEKQALDYFIATQNCDAVDGGIVIYASGNDGYNSSTYPAAYTDYISVTATACDYTPAYYTNYGPGCNISAPGGDSQQSYLFNRTYKSSILSTIPTKYDDSGMGGYGYSQGTSMACPHVSGVAALGLSYALQLGKKMTRAEFTSHLLTAVNDIDSYCTGSRISMNSAGEQVALDLTKYRGQMGSGRIDAFRMLMNLRGITSIPVYKGEQAQLDLSLYVGDGGSTVEVLEVDMSDEDKEALGIKVSPRIFADKVLFTCNKTGGGILKVTYKVGTSSGSGINGMNIVKEFAVISRGAHASNGGWL